MSKNFLTYLPYCLLPALLIAILSYWSGMKTAESTLASRSQAELISLSVELDRRLQHEEEDLTKVSLSEPLGQSLLAHINDVPLSDGPSDGQVPTVEPFLNLMALLQGDGRFERVGLLDQKRTEIWHIERQRKGQSADSFILKRSGMMLFGTNPITGNSVSISLKDSTLQYAIPLLNRTSNEQLGILVAELNLNELVSDVATVLSVTGNSQSAPETFVAAIDPSTRFLYTSNHTLEGALVSSALPSFLPIASSMSENKSDVSRFQIPAGKDYVTAFAPLPRWNVNLAVGHDRGVIAAAAHRSGIIGLLIALLLGSISALSLAYLTHKRSVGIERVEEGLTAIAKGELDRRIELKSSDDARAIADSINAMAEKMRAQIAKEEETKQFQMFVRLSAMLTHDLKNAIEALSLIVGNMERHFDNEEFRRDALKSLTSATEKLKGIVARLTRPLTSLSGEHPRPKSVDLVPMMRKVVAMTAEPLREKHRIEINLPQNLFVYTDPDRIEKVIENFIINALEAMSDKNGKLVIEAGLTTRGAATFSITDTGPGMSPEFIDQKLFKPFSTTKKQGVGLGLYTCREVIEASAGSIEVESVQGAGTTFRVVLPSASHDSRY
jgi:signal transduction histidine kinase